MRVLVLGVPDALDDEIARWRIDGERCFRYASGPRDADKIAGNPTHGIALTLRSPNSNWSVLLALSAVDCSPPGRMVWSTPL